MKSGSLDMTQETERDFITITRKEENGTNTLLAADPPYLWRVCG